MAEILLNGMENVQAVGSMAVYRNKSLILRLQGMLIAVRPSDPPLKIQPPPNPEPLLNFPKLVTMIKPAFSLAMGN